MISEINYDFYNKYPRVYIIAETYGFNQLDISKMIDVLGNDSLCSKLYGTKETVLKMILIRSGLRRNDFYERLNEFRFINYIKSLDEIEKYVGKHCVVAYVTLIANKNKLM